MDMYVCAKFCVI